MNKSDLKILSIIPARGGSKRLPGKNIKKLCGKPLIAWTIEASLKSKYVNKTIVSTDCEKIAEIAKKHGAEVPFLRPKDISQDETEIPEVILHCLDNLEEEFSHLLLLQPTCPLRTAEDIDGAVELLKDKSSNAIYSVCEVAHSPLWSNTLPEDRSFDKFLNPKIAGIRSQRLPQYYRLNGSIYLVKLTEFLKLNSLFGHKKTHASIMDRNSSADIDEELDFLIAEYLLQSTLKNNK